MNRLKKVLLIALASCAAVCISVAVSACDKTVYPNFREPAGGVITKPDDGTGEPAQGNYTINVISEGGLPLNGVIVTLKKNGENVVSGITSGGYAAFDVEPDEYDIELDRLPEGYFIEEGKQYSTKADETDFTVIVSSAIIEAAAPSTTSYSVGDVMHDFAFKDGEGNANSLLSCFEGKKAVVLNFWYVNCSACILEFPAIQSAYEAYSDKLEFIALSNQDSSASIAKFKSDYNYTFQMVYDAAGITKMFGVQYYPTTVIIDRYGVIAYIDSGNQTSDSIWKGLFNTYTSDDYVQVAPDDDDSTDDDTFEWAKPTDDLTTPLSSYIENAILDDTAVGKVSNFHAETSEGDAEYSWPWLLDADDDGNDYLTASNSKVGYSFAIIYFDVALEAGDILSYEYNYETETGNDVFYVLINKQIVKEYSGFSDGWNTENEVYHADRSAVIEVALCYMKDAAEDTGTDSVSVRNICVFNVATTKIALDWVYSVVDNATLTDGKYDLDIEYDAEDNLYYYVYEDEDGNARKSLLLADIINVAAWADIHYGSETFITPENTSAKSSLYLFSFWLMSNQNTKDDDSYLIFDYDDGNTYMNYLNGTLSSVIIQAYYLQEFSDNGYVPVTPNLITAIQAFIKEAVKTGLIEDEYYEDEWLEFCYYFRHYGPEHKNGKCNETLNPVFGLIYDYAYTANLGANHVNITKIINLNDGGGINFVFTPDKTGVYYFYSVSDKEGADPRLIIHDENGKLLADADDDVRYDRFESSNYFNFYAYVELEAGKSYRIQTTMSTPGGTGEYDLNIEYAGTYIEFLRVCSTGDGAWIPIVNEDGSFSYDVLEYMAIDAAYNETTGYYHKVTEDNDYGSIIYIDFIHQNYFDSSGHSLYYWIKAGMFDFSDQLLPDYTPVLMEYYDKAISRDEDDELYGMIEADKELVQLICDMLEKFDEEDYSDSLNTGFWLSMACYYEYYGVQ